MSEFDDLMNTLLSSSDVSNTNQSEDVDTAQSNFDKQFPGSDAVVEQHTGSSSLPDVPLASDIPPSAGSPMGTKIDNGNVAEIAEPMPMQSSSSNPQQASLVAQLTQNHPEIASQPNGNQIIQQLANTILQGISSGGQFSNQAMEASQNALSPVNAAMAFGQNQMMGAGTPGGLKGSPMVPGSVASNPMNAQFDNLKNNAESNLGLANKAYSSQLGSQINQELLGGDNTESSNGMTSLFSKLTAMSPDQQYPLLMRMSMSPQLKPIADMLLTSPSMKEYTAQVTAAGTERGKAQVGATVNATGVESTVPSILTNLQTLRNINNQTPSSFGSTKEYISGVTGGTMYNQSAKNKGLWDTTVNNNLIPELNNMQQAMQNPESTATPALRQQVISIIEEAKAIDSNLSPQERLAKIDAVEKSINQMSESADYKAFALGGKAPPANSTKIPPFQTTVPMTLNGSNRMIPANLVDQYKAQGATVMVQ